jgi:hypothetical protein
MSRSNQFVEQTELPDSRKPLAPRAAVRSTTRSYFKRSGRCTRCGAGFSSDAKAFMARESVTMGSFYKTPSLRTIVALRMTCLTGEEMPFNTRRSSTRGMPRGLFGRNDLIAAHSKSVSSYRMIRAPVWTLESRPTRCLQPAKPETRYFRDYPVSGHIPDMPKSTRMTHFGR